MAVNREAALKTAEKLLRQGKLDGAIAEYVRLVEDQPRDWNSINALGDLYARAGNTERAVEQFTRIAEHLFADGFVPKAAALYKKALKTKSDHEPTLLRLAEIAAGQGLIADARMYVRQLAEQRRGRGDARGAAECLVRLGTLPDADIESKLNAARAAQDIGDVATATLVLKNVARDLDKAGRGGEALDALVEAAQLDPTDSELRTHLVRECVRANQPERARLFLTAESAGDDPQLLLACATIEMTGGEDQRGRSALIRLLTVSPDHHAEVLQLARALAESGNKDRAYDCVDVLTDAAILSDQSDRAVDVLRWFVGVSPRIPALSKLIELCIDADLHDIMRETQAKLVDAYLAAGSGAEARVIAEDLVGVDAAAHIPRLRAALELLGVPDVEGAIADTLRSVGELDLPADGDSGLGLDHVGADEPMASQIELVSEPPAVASPEPAPLEAETDDLDSIEIDLSTALYDIGRTTVSLPPVSAAAQTVDPPPDLDSAFEDLRTRISSEPQTSAAAQQLERGMLALDAGRVDEALGDLQAAAKVPLFRFKACAALGRLHIGRGDLDAGIEWLERAADAPAPSADEGFALVYELADVLELLGEPARALAVLMELGAHAGEYRDVRSRIEHLTRVQAGSHGG